MVELLKNVLALPVAVRQTRKDYKENKKYYDNFTAYYMNEYEYSNEYKTDAKCNIIKGYILSVLLFFIPTKVLFSFTGEV